MNIADLTRCLNEGRRILVTTMELSAADLAKGLTMTTAHDADTQLAEARRTAHAWLRATLATLPAAVSALSIGAALDDGGDRPTLVPRLKAKIGDGFYSYPIDVNIHFDDTDDRGKAMTALYDLDDDIRHHTRHFLFALRDEEWVTVTRADLAEKAAADAPIVRGDGPTIATITAALAAMPPTSNLTLRFWRDRNGVLTWETKHKSF